MSAAKPLNVAVTGNAPFLEYDYNTSRMVRDALPDIISAPGNRSVRIFKYHRDTRDTYEDVRQVSKDIWAGNGRAFSPDAEGKERDQHVQIDIILHLGMIALGWDHNQFRFEKVARRDGYHLPGEDGKFVDSDQLKSLGLPETLATSLDVEAGWHRVKEKFPDVTSCVSDDAGLYFCELRLYSSLAEPILTDSLKDKQGRVAFAHLPQAHDDESIALARDIIVAFITGLADSELAET